MIYIHVPFCKSRCLYCDFFSSTELGLRSAYVDALCHEMDVRREEMLAAGAETVYLGGGTPSQLGTDSLKRIFNHLETSIFPRGDLRGVSEITLEANPDDISDEFVEALHETPINRISMGVQTLNDGLLRFLGRRHSAKVAVDAVETLRRNGYENLSLDLMYGLPGQTMEMWKRDVDRMLAMQIPHLSAYALQWEVGTRLYSMLERGEVEEADEELSLEMYEYLMDATARAGMHHYEISNFAVPGMEARHNSGYWRDDAYVGLGPGAHSYDGARRRSWNVSDIRAYCNGTDEGGYELLSDTDLYNEKVMKRLRTDAGLCLDELKADEREHALKMAESHIRDGRMVLAAGHLRLTRKGIFVSNDIISDLML